MKKNDLPIAVIGAGPIGLAAAAHLIGRGKTPVIFEAGKSVGASVLKWGHVRMFSQWKYNVDAEARKLLDEIGWKTPEAEDLPTGRELVEQYLIPLGAHPLIKPHLRLNTKVVSITRHGFGKMENKGRENAPFALQIQNSSGAEESILAMAVIDASGTYEFPNPLGAGGFPGPGERKIADHIFYGIPDVIMK